MSSVNHTPAHRSIHGLHPAPRPGLEGVLYAGTLPPLLGDWRVDRYEHGLPVEVPNDPLLGRLAKTGLLATVYATAAKHLLKVAPWNAGLPAWAALLAFSEGRQASDRLGQIQNGLQAALPLLIGGYAAVPVGNWMAQGLSDRENRQLFEQIRHPAIQRLAHSLTGAHEAVLEQRLKNTPAHLPWDSDAPTRQELSMELQEAKRLNQVFRQDLDAFQTHLQQHELHHLPVYRQQLADLKGDIFRQDGLPFEGQKMVLPVLDEAVGYLGKVSQDDRPVAPYFNSAEAQQLRDRLASAQEAIQASDLPEAVKQQADTIITPVKTLLTAPAEAARAWFSPQQLTHRMETLEALKTKLSDHLARFDRPMLEQAFEHLDRSEWLQGLSLPERKVAFEEATQRFGKLLAGLAQSQKGHFQMVKQWGGPAAFVLGCSLVGNWLAKRVNLMLADELPDWARSGNGHRNSRLEDLSAAYDNAYEAVDPGIHYVTENNPLGFSSPAHYVSWVNTEAPATPWTLHSPDDK